MNENHFGYYHDSCNLEYLFDEFNNGDLWKHTAFQVYKHDLCPVTFRDESYIPFFTCTNYLNEIDEKFQVINKKFKNINEILGNFSHIRLCKNEDEILLSKKLLTQTSLICFNPNRRGRIGFLNRHYLKKILPQNMRYLVEIARKSPKYKFINLYNKEVLQLNPNISNLADLFWKICNSKKLEIMIIDELFNKHEVNLNNFFY